MSSLHDISWADYSALSIEGKVPLLARPDGMPFHTLFAQQFGRKELDRICDLATKIRFIAKSRDGMDFLQGLLSHKRAMIYFTQPSSRTFLSFLSACQILGIKTGEVRDAVPIINAGSGKDQHPTQALLDIYTLNRSFEKKGGLANRTVMYVGDLARGRTVRSLSNLLTNYEGIRHVFVAPPQLQIGDDIVAMLKARGNEVVLSDDMRAWLPRVDAVYMTRIQDEWDATKGESARIDTSRFKIGAAEMALMGANAILMHPLPRRDEISTDCDSDPRAKYWRQMRNGMWVRTALIAATFDCDDMILAWRSRQ
jgi:aspartate carbamoyltransferase catalytic subunit